MALSLSHQIPIPVRKARFSVPVTYRDTAGAITNPTGPDTEVSVDGGANWTDAAEEVSPTAGHGYLTLSGAEMDNRSVMVQAKGTGVLTEVFTVTPQDLPILASGTATAGAATSITLAVGSSGLDDYYNGCIVRTTGGTGGGGTGGANNQARVITDYVGSTRVATVTTWETNPSSDTTYDILVPIGWHHAPGARILLGIPAVAPGSNGGLPTANASNQVLALDGAGGTIAAALLAVNLGFPGATQKTLAEALQVAWAQGKGRWHLVGTTLTLYAPDGSTALVTFTLDDGTTPTERTPA
jgi:hypothetical protein